MTLLRHWTVKILGSSFYWFVQGFWHGWSCFPGKYTLYSHKDINWFLNYLSARTQCVDFAGYSSVFFRVLNGVPQGSISEPAPFSIYVNNLCVAFHCYADDTGKNAFKYSAHLTWNNFLEGTKIEGRAVYFGKT